MRTPDECLYHAQSREILRDRGMDELLAEADVNLVGMGSIWNAIWNLRSTDAYKDRWIQGWYPCE